MTYDEDSHHRVSTKQSTEHQSLKNRFEAVSETYATRLPAWQDFPAEAWPPTWRYDAERLAVDMQYKKQDMKRTTNLFKQDVARHPNAEQDNNVGSVAESEEIDGEVAVEGDDWTSLEEDYESKLEFEDDEFLKVMYKDDGWLSSDPTKFTQR